MANRSATPWGPARTLDEVKVQQRAGEKRFSSILQLLENAQGERLVRFAYATGRIARRGPVTLRATDLVKLRASVAADHAELADVLGWRGGGA